MDCPFCKGKMTYGSLKVDFKTQVSSVCECCSYERETECNVKFHDYEDNKIYDVSTAYRCTCGILLYFNNTTLRFIEIKQIDFILFTYYKMYVPGMKSYQTHWNYARPFLVTVIDNYISVYTEESYNKIIGSTYSEQPFLTFNVSKIFIGKSPLNTMTNFSGGYGVKFDGNSILLELSEHKYVYIGNIVYSFETDEELISYVSPVGNNDVPYPYAVGQSGKFYLMIENVILEPMVFEKGEDPYKFYYTASKFLQEIDCIILSA